MRTEEFCKAFCVERKGTSVLKWDSLVENFGDADLTPLWVADMEFRSPNGVVEAIKKRADHGAFGYGMVPDSYYEAFTAWQKNHHGAAVEKKNIRFGTGVVGSLYTLVSAFTKPSDSVIICPPVYYPFYDAVLNSGRQLALCELDNHDGRYMLDFDKFEKTIVSSGARMFILCSPHNPVSRLWSEQELDKMFDICQRHGVLVISDEIHQDFTGWAGKFIPASIVTGGKYRDNLLVLNSASKTFNLAGMIHSHVIIENPELMQTYDKFVHTIGMPEANVFGLVSMEAAWRTGDEWLTDLKAVICENYAFVRSEMNANAPKVVVTPLEGTYLMWMDLRAYVEPEQVCEFITKKCRLALDVGEWFSVNAKGFIRMNLATNPKYVHLAVKNILSNLV